MPAPVAIFAYKRPDATRRLIESLLANPEARATKVFAFCDGPRSAADADAVAATRRVLRSAGIPGLTMVERDANVGLAASIIDGVTRLCAEHGRAVVLEDDLVLAPTFLAYMNDALERYRHSERVYHVSGFMYDVRVDVDGDVLFLPFISSWGWATWERAWRQFDVGASGLARLDADRALRRRFDLGGRYKFHEMLTLWRSGRLDIWAARWYLSVFLHDGLAVFPVQSLVENRGFGDPDATHCAGGTPRHVQTTAVPFRVRRFREPQLDAAAFDRVRRFMGHDATLRARGSAFARRVLARLTR